MNIVETGSCYRPPSGCLQYHYQQAEGRLTSFNFQADQSTHLADQRYNICIHRLPGILKTIRYNIPPFQMSF